MRPLRRAAGALWIGAAQNRPAHREAYTRLTKSQVGFPGILDAYRAVEAWITESGETVGAASREVYFTDWDTAGPDDPACDVAYPLQG